MESAIALNNEDVKKIIAERFNVPVKNVIKSQYTYTVIGVKGREILGIGSAAEVEGNE